MLAHKVRHSPEVAERNHAFVASQPHQLLFLSAGKEIYAQGEKATALYQVEFGTVRLYRLLSDGRRQISAFCLAGEVFGFEAEGQHRFFAEAVCNSAVRVHRIPGEPGMAGGLLSAAVSALVRAQEHLLVIGRQSAAERVAAFLLDMADRQEGIERIELAMSRTDIGDYLGLTIETVSRVFSKLRQQKLIRLEGARNVVLVKPEALKAMCA
jgi:CRP/FNR family transcriptional regulator, nitrogen fixation regulation protein